MRRAVVVETSKKAFAMAPAVDALINRGARESQSDAPVSFNAAREIDDDDQLRCLTLILDQMNRGGFSELWLGPFLRDLTDEMPDLADYQRRRLVSDLTRNGAIAVEKREGDPYPFSVILVNYNHPSVRRSNVVIPDI